MSGMTTGVGSTEQSGQAKEAMSTAANRAGEVATEAKGQARNVAQEAKSQARDLAEHTKQELRDQAQTRGKQAADGLRTFADRLGSLANGDTEAAGPLVGYLEEGRGRIAELAGRLEEGPDAVLEDVRRFARSKPLVFLASAGVLGFVTGRLVRAGSGAGSSSGQGMAPTISSGTSTIGMPSAGAPAPGVIETTPPTGVTGGVPGGITTPTTPTTYEGMPGGQDGRVTP